MGKTSGMPPSADLIEYDQICFKFPKVSSLEAFTKSINAMKKVERKGIVMFIFPFQTVESLPLRGALEVIVKTQVQEAPRDVAVDSVNRKIYWTALCCGLRRADLDGRNEEVVASADFASGVAIHQGFAPRRDEETSEIIH